MQRGKKRNWSIGSGKQTETQPHWQAAVKGLVLAWGVTLVLLFAIALMIYWEWVGADLIAVAAKGLMIISMAAGGIYVFKKTKGSGRIWVLIMLIGYLAVRFLLSVILTFL